MNITRMFRMLTIAVCPLALPSTVLAGSPSFDVSIFGQAPSNIDQICFNADGVMFIGNDIDTKDVPIYRLIGWGGDAVPFGPALPDPDAVVVDINGVICGTPGGILVGGNNGSRGYVAAIHPCTGELIAKLWNLIEPTNIADMVFNSSGELLICQPTFGVYSTSDSSEPKLLCRPFEDGPQRLAVNKNDEIFTSTSGGTVSLYAPDGTFLDEEYITGLGLITGLAVGPGGTWGQDLYVSNQTGQLYRVDSDHSATEIISDLGTISDLVFGPDDALYAADESSGSILKITIQSCPSDLNGDGTVGASDLLTLLVNWGPCP